MEILATISALILRFIYSLVAYSVLVWPQEEQEYEYEQKPLQ